MQDGALMGARFDLPINADTDHYRTNELAIPVLSTNDSDTAANELRTHIIMTGSAVERDEGMFSMRELLGYGMSSDEGARFVTDAVETISKVRADVAALLALDTPPPTLETSGGILDTQWDKLETALDSVFGTDSDAQTDPTFAVRADAPRREDILDDIDDILDALASEDSFVAATAEDGGGVFESQALGAGAAADAFNRVTWSATATMGTNASTRFGTVIRKVSDDGTDGPDTMEYGAFSYSTMDDTPRTSQAAAVSLTGIASYTGGTEAISAKGTTYSGTMDLQVRFAANTVSGVVSGLEDAEGLPWQHNFADVDRIVLSDARLLRNSQFTTATGDDAPEDGTVFFTADSGLLRPVDGLTNTFRGILLGTGAAAGSEANGVWEVNTPTSTNYLTGGFGVSHIGDATRPTPGGDAGGASNSTLMNTEVTDGITTPTVSVGDGKLTVKVQRYGWADLDGNGTLTYQGRVNDDGDETTTDDPPTLATAEFDLETLAGNAIGSKTTVNGPKWADGVKTTLESQRDQIATLQGLGTRTASTRAAEAAAWQTAVNTIQYELFGGHLPMKLVGDYATDSDLQEDALDLLGRAIDALSNANNLFAATDPNGTGIFDHYDSNADADPTVVADDDIEDFIYYDATNNRRWETTGNNRALGAFLGEREYKVVASLGTTNYTRFGVWYRVGAVSAERWSTTHSTAATGAGVKKEEGGPGSFAYSPLDPTMAGNAANPAFPLGGSASFVGEAVAIQDEEVLSGTATVDVSWASATTTIPLDLAVSADGTTDVASHAGTMSVTIGDMTNGAGDPLTHRADGVTTGPGNEIAEIVFSGMNIEVGLPGGNSGSLIVGEETAGDPDADGNVAFTYGEVTVAAATDVRYRLAAIGMDDVTGDGGTFSVGALFVGQGVDGPLGVIGTFTLNDADVHRMSGDGLDVTEGAEIIYGGFGADVP